MPAARAWSTGAVKAVASVTDRAMPSTWPEIAALVASTISATIASAEPVHWVSTFRIAAASSRPYWVGVKNGWAVTWLTNVNRHRGVSG
jgi:hypothetical protein